MNGKSEEVRVQAVYFILPKTEGRKLRRDTQVDNIRTIKRLKKEGRIINATNYFNNQNNKSNESKNV